MPLVQAHGVGDCLVRLPSSIGFCPSSLELLDEAPSVQPDQVLMRAERLHEDEDDGAFSYYSCGGLIQRLRSDRASTFVLLKGVFAK